MRKIVYHLCWGESHIPGANRVIINAPVKFVFPKDYILRIRIMMRSAPWSKQDPSQFLNQDGTPNWEKIRANLVGLALKLPDLDPTPDGTGTEPGKLSGPLMQDLIEGEGQGPFVWSPT